jgi:hypothetical protein
VALFVKRISGSEWQYADIIQCGLQWFLHKIAKGSLMERMFA